MDGVRRRQLTGRGVGAPAVGRRRPPPRRAELHRRGGRGPTTRHRAAPGPPARRAGPPRRRARAAGPHSPPAHLARCHSVARPPHPSGIPDPARWSRWADGGGALRCAARLGSHARTRRGRSSWAPNGRLPTASASSGRSLSRSTLARGCRWAGSTRVYSGYGGEDTDYAMLLARAEGRLWWVRGAVAYHQHHDIESPPTRHLEAIVRNSSRFHGRWGVFPVEGWLGAFEAQGLITCEGKLMLTAVPTRGPAVRGSSSIAPGRRTPRRSPAADPSPAPHRP